MWAMTCPFMDVQMLYNVDSKLFFIKSCLVNLFVDSMLSVRVVGSLT